MKYFTQVTFLNQVNWPNYNHCNSSHQLSQMAKLTFLKLCFLLGLEPAPWIFFQCWLWHDQGQILNQLLESLSPLAEHWGNLKRPRCALLAASGLCINKECSCNNWRAVLIRMLLYACDIPSTQPAVHQACTITSIYRFTSLSYFV